MHTSFSKSIKFLIAALVPPLLFYGICSAQNLISAPPELSALIDEGLSNNQSIKQMEAQIDAATERISVAGALPDPEIGISVLNLPVSSFRFDREAMTQKQLTISQKIPWLSKLNLKSKTAALNVKAQKARLLAAELSLARKIADSWYELGYVSKSLNINARLTELARQIRREAEDQYVVGNGLQQNILQAAVELVSIEDEKIMLENRFKKIQDRLNGLLNRSMFVPVDPPKGLPEPVIEPARMKLKNAALENNPNLSALKAEIEYSEVMIELAKKDYLPDWKVTLAYGQRDENPAGKNFTDFFSAGVRMSLPFWHEQKQDKNLSSALSASRAAKAAYDNMASELLSRVDVLVTELADAKSRYELYTDKLIPEAKQWARSAIDAYQVGKVDFDRMIGARIRVLRFELKAERFLYDVFQKQAAIEELVGKRIVTNEEPVKSSSW